MKKKIFAIILAGLMVASLTACGGGGADSATESSEAASASVAEASSASEATAGSSAAEEAAPGTVFNIYAWNEEFKGFFEKYYTVPEGITVNWIITPSDNGAYQQKLDEALLNQESASANEKVDLFLAESDYIQKYVESEYTADIAAIGVTDFSNTYEYTVKAATDPEGGVKGVSFQCCPAGVIYRRSIAQDVLGVSEPEDVQPLIDSWEKFDDVAKQAKEKGYYMTASFAETFRTFSNNTEKPWVDADNNLQFDPQIEAWIAQTENYVENGYTLTAGVWDAEKTDQMFATGKTMCFFGPAWYFNFCMTNAQDPDSGCMGDWAIVEGPQTYFWGGNWLLCPAGTDNPDIVADIMNTFINDEDVCSKLVANEAQFSNNQVVNQKFAEDPDYGSEFLGGQNDVAFFCSMTDSIKWENHTIYDQLLNEGLQNTLQEYFKGNATKDEALANFYNYVNETYPTIVTP